MNLATKYLRLDVRLWPKSYRWPFSSLLSLGRIWAVLVGAVGEKTHRFFYSPGSLSGSLQNRKGDARAPKGRFGTSFFAGERSNVADLGPLSLYP